MIRQQAPSSHRKARSVNTRLTRQSQVEEAFRLWSQKTPRRQIAEALGCSTGHVGNLLKEHPDYTPRDMSGTPRLTPDQIARYEAGTPAADLAEEVGVTSPTIVRWLRESGVRVRTKKEAAVLMGRKKQIPIDTGRMLDLRAQGMSAREIGQALGVSDETIRSRLEDLGVDRLPAKARTERNAFWNGGLVVDKHGYILAKSPDHPRATKGGYVRLHRLVMERHLGRLLGPEEVVDHIDGDRTDNRIHNLHLYPSNAEHLRSTLRGRHELRHRLSRPERLAQEREDRRRSTDLVASIHRERASGERLSLSELDRWIDELATGAPTP